MDASDRPVTVAIIGLGLIGGSLARALRRAGFAHRFIGYGHRLDSLVEGESLGVIDAYSLDLREAVAEADLVVLAAPTRVTEQLLPQVLAAPFRRPGPPPVITDVASVKGNLLRAARAAGAGQVPANVILGHPIAGSERSGVGASDPDLFTDHRVILTPVEGNDPAALELVRAMWRCTGAEIVEMGVQEHDEVLAATSHLPHMLAYALVDTLADAPRHRDIFRFAAGGFRDFSRIASSDPVMWRDIALANREAMLDAVDGFSEHLAALRRAIDAGEAADLEQIFARAKAVRDQFTADLEVRGADIRAATGAD